MCARKRYFWEGWGVEDLLDLRLSDLGLRIAGTVLEERIDQVRREMRARGLVVTPYFWLSDDWFTPDGYTGTAIPFYLAHPRLVRLEQSQLGEAEGSTRRSCMQLIRHEMGHVVDHAFRLHRRRRWQRLFGLSSHRYPRFYRPNPESRQHVQHLEYWYAQAHPDEDFAETFAVWLTPRSIWRRKYTGWPALRKLEYVDELMAGIAGQRPVVRTKAHIDPLVSLKKTLREHYERKRSAYADDHPHHYDRDLLRLFSRKGSETAASFIRRVGPEVLASVSVWAGEHRYQLEHVIKDMAGRCQELRLRANGSRRKLKEGFAIVLTKHAMISLYRHRKWIEM
jgi:hypothetical protein